MFYDFSLQPVDERMYLLIEKEKALMIDPFVCEEVEKLLTDCKINEILILLTHEHYDHIMGVNDYRKKYRVKVLCTEACGERIGDTKTNLSARYEVFYLLNTTMDQEAYRRMCQTPFVTYADVTFHSTCQFTWEGHEISMVATPGHSPGSCCIVIDEKNVFTGDSLVNGFPTITRYPGGSKKLFEQVTIPFLNRIDGDAIIYPGHGERAKRSSWGIL